MNDDKPSGQTQVIQNNDPWSGQQSHLTFGFNQARDLFNTPMQRYPNSMVVPFSNQTNQALNMQEQRAREGSGLLANANQSLVDTAGGDYLNSNPHFDQTVDAASRAVTRNFNNNVMPAIDSKFSGSGRYGSGMHKSLIEDSAEDLNRQVSDMAGGMAFQNYNAERNNMMQAAAMAPQMAAADYQDAAQLERVGQVREAQAGAELQEDIDRFNFAQREPRDRLAEYMALVAGGSFGGSSTTTQPIFRNPVSEGLGALGTVAGIGGSLFGQGGVWPGAFS